MQIRLTLQLHFICSSTCNSRAHTLSFHQTIFRRTYSKNLNTMIKYLILISNILSSSRTHTLEECLLSYISMMMMATTFYLIWCIFYVFCSLILFISDIMSARGEYYYFNFQHIKEANKFISTIFWTTQTFSCA